MELKENLKDSKYVLIIDESTDITTMKHLCVAVAYLPKDGKIQTDFIQYDHIWSAIN